MQDHLIIIILVLQLVFNLNFIYNTNFKKIKKKINNNKFLHINEKMTTSGIKWNRLSVPGGWIYYELSDLNKISTSVYVPDENCYHCADLNN